MRDLAGESGVAPKTLYHQFENKKKPLLEGTL
jgi:AcrR family transcriptional regulator